MLRPFVGALKNLGAAEAWNRSALWFPFRAADRLVSRYAASREMEAGPISLFVFQYALPFWFFAFPFIPTSASIALIWFLVLLDLMLRAGTVEVNGVGWRPFFDLPGYIRFPYYLMAVVLVLSAGTSLAPKSSMISLELWATYLVLVLLVLDITRVGGESVKTRSFGTLIAGAVVVSAIGLLQFSKGIETSAAWIDPAAREEIKTRVYSVFDNPNMLSIYLVSVTPIVCEQFLSSRRLVWLGSLALILTCLGLTFSRAGWASAVFGLTMFAILKDKRLIAVLAIALVLAALLAPGVVLDRAISTVTFQDSSSRYRVTIWRATLRLIEDFWPSGLGLGHVPFTFVYPRYEIAGTPAAHTHNLYLQFIVETGALGLISFLWLCLGFLGKAFVTAWSFTRKAKDRWAAVRTRRGSSRDASSVARSPGILAALTAALACQLLYGVGDNAWYNPKNALLFWALFGFAIHAIASREGSSQAAAEESADECSGNAGRPSDAVKRPCADASLPDCAGPTAGHMRSSDALATPATAQVESTPGGDARPRVLHVVSDRNVGGAGRYVMYLLQRPAMREFDIEVACPGEGRLIQELSFLGTKVIPLSPACQDRSLSLGGIRDLYRIMKRNKYDIVHSHSSLSARIAARLSGTRGVIYTRHGLGGTSGFGSTFSRLAQRFFSTYFADAIIAVSRAAAENLAQSGVVPHKITVIENGVIIPATKPLPTGLSETSGATEGTNEPAPVVGTVGRLSPEKGHSVFIRAAALVHHQFPACRFLIVGDGPLRSQLQSLAEDLGLKDQIEFVGYQPDVRTYLGSMDVFALPSYTEAMPLSLLEAMAMGLPVVASKVGGVPEIVQDGVTGFLTAPGDEKDLADKTIKLLRSSGLRKAMGESGRETVKSKFDVDVMARRVTELYRAVLAAR